MTRERGQGIPINNLDDFKKNVLGRTQDEQGIRADLIRTMVIGYGFIYGHKHVKKQVDKVADQILSQTVSSGGGKCPECGGCGKVWDSLSHHMDYQCPTCNGTGSLPVEEKSVGEIIKEWES